jgi:hypothetical protein
MGARGSVVGWVTMLQSGRSQFRVPMKWIYFFCQSQSYFTTGSLPPISSSWSQAPWKPRPIFFNWIPALIDFNVTSSLTRRWVFLFLAAWDPRYILWGRTTQKTPLRLLFLLIHCCRDVFTAQLLRNQHDADSRGYAACKIFSVVAWHHTVRDAFFCMCTGHYLGTAVSLPQKFLLWANTPYYLHGATVYKKYLCPSFFVLFDAMLLPPEISRIT